MGNIHKTGVEQPSRGGARTIRSIAGTFLAALLTVSSFSSHGESDGHLLDAIRVQGIAFDQTLLHLYSTNLEISNINFEMSLGDLQFNGGQDASMLGCGRGNPIMVASGNKIEPETDFISHQEEFPLTLRRAYNTNWGKPLGGIFGRNWISSFDYALNITMAPDGTPLIFAARPDGRYIKFRQWDVSKWVEDKAEPVAYILVGDGVHTLYTEEQTIEKYDSGEGRILSVHNLTGIGWNFNYVAHSYTHSGLPAIRWLPHSIIHTSGHQVELTWEERASLGDSGSSKSFHLVGVRDPAGNLYQYVVDEAPNNGRLSKVIYPGLPVSNVSYHYEDGSILPKLTGKSYNGTRYSIFSYSNGKAVSTEHAGGVERYSFEYLSSSAGKVIQTIETNPLGKKTTYGFNDKGQITSVTGHASANCLGAYKERTYDANNYDDLAFDFSNGLTDYDYAANGQLQKKLEQVVNNDGSRITLREWQYQWDVPNNRIVKEVLVGDHETSYAYWADNRIKSITTKNLSAKVAASAGQSRTVAYSYTKHPNGMLATVAIDGPLSGDTITKTYSTTGDLIEVKNSLGHGTIFSNYNSLGQPGRITGPNGDATDYTYDARGRMTAVKPIIGGVARPTTYAYDSSGRLAEVTTADGHTRTKEYDAAGRLVREYEPEGGGTYAVARYTYNNMSLVTSVVTERTTAVVPPAVVPTLTTPSTGPNGNYTVSWSAVPSAEYYLLEERLGSGVWGTAFSGSALSKAFSGKPAGTYEYRVKACNAAGCTGSSGTGAVQSYYPPTTSPILSAPGSVTTGSYSVSWTSVTGATTYQLEEAANGGAWTLIHNAAGTSKAVTDKTAGTYSYRVKACNGAGCGPISATVSVVEIDSPTSAPTVTAPAADSDGAFTVSWTSVSTTTSYRLEQRKDAGSWSQVYSGTGLSTVMSGLTNGNYDYRARACNAGGCSAYSALETTVVTYPPTGVPALTAPATSNNGSFTVSWTSISAATRYELQQRKDSTSFGTVYNSSGISKAISGLGNGSYEYRVRACNAGGCAAFSAIKTTVVTHPPGTPTVTAPSANNNGAFTVSWTSVSTTTSYRLEQSKDAGSWSQIYSGTGLSTAMSGLTNGNYDYRARACNAGGCSAYSAIKTTVVTFPPSTAPTLSAPASADISQSFTVSWTTVSTATSYELQSNKNNGSWSTIYSGSANYVSRSHNYDGSYGYRVRACNVGGCGPFSVTETVHVVDVGGGPCYEGVCPEPEFVDPTEEES